MRSLMILGGMTGFAIGVGFGVAQGGAWPSILWRASVAACVAGLLLRWWGNVCLKSLQQAHRERIAQAARAGAQAGTDQAKV